MQDLGTLFKIIISLWMNLFIVSILIIGIWFCDDPYTMYWTNSITQFQRSSAVKIRRSYATTDTTTAPQHTTRSNVDKTEEETVKAEPPSAQSYMTREQDNKKFNNPFIVGAAVWQTSVTYWLMLMGNSLKMRQKWQKIGMMYFGSLG